MHTVLLLVDFPETNQIEASVWKKMISGDECYKLHKYGNMCNQASKKGKQQLEGISIIFMCVQWPQWCKFEFGGIKFWWKKNVHRAQMASSKHPARVCAPPKQFFGSLSKCTAQVSLRKGAKTLPIPIHAHIWRVSIRGKRKIFAWQRTKKCHI